MEMPLERSIITPKRRTGREEHYSYLPSGGGENYNPCPSPLLEINPTSLYLSLKNKKEGWRNGYLRL